MPSGIETTTESNCAIIHHLASIAASAASGCRAASSRTGRVCRTAAVAAETSWPILPFGWVGSWPRFGGFSRRTGGNASGSGEVCASAYCLRLACSSGSFVSSWPCSASGPASTSSSARWRSSAVEYCIENRCFTWWLKLSRTTRPPCS